MTDVQEKLSELHGKGWTLAAIAHETGNHVSTIEKWKSGFHYPNNSKMVLMGLDALLQRKRIPKRRRYAPGEHHTQRKSQQAED